jgi:hypothetical protein
MFLRTWCLHLQVGWMSKENVNDKGMGRARAGVKGETKNDTENVYCLCVLCALCTVFVFVCFVYCLCVLFVCFCVLFVCFSLLVVCFCVLFLFLCIVYVFCVLFFCILCTVYR